MSGRGPRRRALGLRARIVGVVLVTAVVTLAVAALALLGPLENSLRHAELNTLKANLGRSATTPFGQIDPGLVFEEKVDRTREKTVYEQGRRARQLLLDAASRLGTRLPAAEVVILLPETSHRATPIVIWPTDSDIAHDDTFSDAPKAFHSTKPVYTLGSIDGVEYARAALPFTTASPAPGPRAHWVLVVRKPLNEVTAAVHAVRTAFLYAALAGVVLTLIFAIPLSGKLVWRLRRLRQAAMQLAQGDAAATVPVDRARDEVGDLSRTFAVMQGKLRQQEEARRAFVATASHELRTPLASLDGMLELLDEDLGSGEPDLTDARSLLARARAQSRRLGRLAADLLDLSRLDAQVQLRSEPVELGELSRAVLAEFELGTEERGIQTALDDSTGSVWALGDPGSVAQILRILLDNAVRASPSGAEIRVQLHNGAKACLSVCDQGPGVPSRERDLIFERFQRGSATSGQAGFGLGLAIGRELATRMGGELVLEEGDAPGTVFTLRLPVARAPESDRLAVA